MPAVQRPASQAPQRQRTRVFPTPKVADVIIQQVFESTRTVIPAYGTAHPDTAKYPNHKLVHARVIDEQGLFLELWYAADRSNQEDYNYSLTYPYGGNTSYPRITRTYILPRSPDPLAQGSPDPGGVLFGIGEYRRPEGTFEYRRPDGASQYERSGQSGVLVAQSERPLGDELNGLYVEVTRVYDVIPGLEDQTSSDGLGQTDDGYSVERPLQDKDWIRLTWKISLPRLVADTYRKSNLDQCPIPGYEFLFLVNESIQTSPDSNQVSEIVRVYEGNSSAAGQYLPESSATLTGKSRQLPGVIPPEKFLSYTESQELAKRVLSPDIIDVLPSAPAGWTFVEAKVAPEGTNTGNKVVVSTQYELGALEGKSWDNETRSYIPYTIEVVQSTLAMSLPDIAGEEKNIQPINRYWSIVTTERPSENANTLRSYYTTTPFSWPAVLPSFGTNALQVGTLGRKDRRTGELTGEKVLWYDFELVPAWSGICKAFVEIGWSKSPPAFTPIQAMAPTEIVISWPVGTLRIPKCLHSAYVFTGTTGTENPDWEFLSFRRTVAATNYITWPESIVAEFDVSPYKGGFRTRKVSVFRPYDATPSAIP